MTNVVKSEESLSDTEVKQNVENESPNVKKLLSMGYPLSEARAALSQAKQNLSLAIEYLVEGTDTDVREARVRHRFDHCCKTLSENLLNNPALNDYTVAALMKDARNAEALRELVASNGGQLLQSLLESSSDEAEEIKQE